MFVYVRVCLGMFRTTIVAGACPGGGGPKGPGPPPLKIEKQKKKKKKKKKKVIGANIKLFHLYFATFLSKISFSQLFSKLGPPP